MEKVQFQQEQMLAELKDFAQKGLFTQKEIKHIMKKRTAFETALVRRVAKKGDFLRYAAYEMSLDSLRKKRLERLKLPPSPPSVSDYALVRRQFYIFERALKKFKADVGLWVQYINVAKHEGARALVGRITARALQLHPNTPALYILAASHELEHLSPSAARTLLQRGIRLNPDSVEMWREYVKMELGFVEGLRRRWELLGIQLDSKGKGKDVRRTMDLDGAHDGGDEEDQNRSEGMDVDEDINGDAAKHEIMEGIIVKSVISSAVKALPTIGLFRSLKDLISAYPSPAPLRDAILDHLFALLRLTLPTDPEAVKLHATRSLTPDLAGEKLIDRLKDANEELTQAITDCGSDRQGICERYADFVQEWCQRDIDGPLKLYLVASLQSLANKTFEPALLAAHLELLITVSDTSLPAPGKIVHLARKYTTKQSTSAVVWLARLAVEAKLGSGEDARTVWAEARGAAKGQRMEDVWIWGLEQTFGESPEKRMRLLEGMLADSMRDSCLRTVHETLLVRYAQLALDGLSVGSDGDRDDAATRGAGVVRRIAHMYLPTGRVWAAVFEAADAGGMCVLRGVYDMWMLTDVRAATLAWGTWLLGQGRGAEAKDAVVRARSMLGSEERALLEKAWTEAVAGEDRGAGTEEAEER